MAVVVADQHDFTRFRRRCDYCTPSRLVNLCSTRWDRNNSQSSHSFLAHFCLLSLRVNWMFPFVVANTDEGYKYKYASLWIARSQITQDVNKQHHVFVITICTIAIYTVVHNDQYHGHFCANFNSSAFRNEPCRRLKVYIPLQSTSSLLPHYLAKYDCSTGQREQY